MKRQEKSTEEVQRNLAFEAAGQQAGRLTETEKERERRLQLKSTNTEIARRGESHNERKNRVLSNRLRNQARLQTETEQEADVRRELNVIQTANWRASKNEKEVAERIKEDRIRQARRRDRLRKQQEETENLQRAIEAERHAEIFPLITDEELQFLVGIVEREEATLCVPSGYETLDEATVSLYSCGNMDQICGECDARHFKKERPSDKKFTLCCYKGKVILPPLKPCPELLLHLLTDSHPQSKHFMRNIRNYNNALAMPSMGAKIASPPNRGPYCFRIHGQVYHNTSSVGVLNETNPRYAPLYFMDSEQATDIRTGIAANSVCDRGLMKALDQLLRQVNPYTTLYKTMSRVLEEEHREAEAEGRPYYTAGMIIHGDRKTHDRRRYNRPTTSEIAVIFKSKDGAPPTDRSIRGHLLIPTRSSKFVEIKPHMPMCDPMTYPLLFPNGDNGWHPNMQHTSTTRAERDLLLQEMTEDIEEVDGVADLPDEVLARRFFLVEGRRIVTRPTPSTSSAASNTLVFHQDAPEIEDALPVEDELEEDPDFKDDADPDDDQNFERAEGGGTGVKKRTRITQTQFYCSWMAHRPYFNNVLAGGPLTQQFIVDSYVEVESNRLKYIKENQVVLHVAQYKGLHDFINNRAEREQFTIGTVCILPSTFIGSPRAMKQSYQDAMAISGKFGKPTFFVTITCNP